MGVQLTVESKCGEGVYFWSMVTAMQLGTILVCFSPVYLCHKDILRLRKFSKYLCWGSPHFFLPLYLF